MSKLKTNKIQEYLQLQEVILLFIDKGILWVDIEYADMPNFTPTITSPQENIVVPVIDNSIDSNEKALIAWIKDNN